MSIVDANSKYTSYMNFFGREPSGDKPLQVLEVSTLLNNLRVDVIEPMGRYCAREGSTLIALSIYNKLQEATSSIRGIAGIERKKSLSKEDIKMISESDENSAALASRSLKS